MCIIKWAVLFHITMIAVSKLLCGSYLANINLWSCDTSTIFRETCTEQFTRIKKLKFCNDSWKFISFICLNYCTVS